MKETGLSFLKCTASNCMRGTSEYVRHAALWRPEWELCYRKGLVDEPPEGKEPAGAPA